MTATVAPKPPVTREPEPAVPRPSQKSARRTKRKRLGPTRRPSSPIRWRTLPFAGFIAALLSSGLLALLVVNNSLAAGSFERARLKAERTLLFEQEQALNQEVLRLSSPTKLRSEALRLGMVSAASTAFLDVSNGKILGIPKATGPGAKSAASEGSDAETTGLGQPGESDPTSSDTSPESTGDDGTPSGEAASEGTEDQAVVTDPPEAGDGAQVSPGTAQDRAIVSGGG